MIKPINLDLEQLRLTKSAELGREITWKEVSESIGVPRSTLIRYYKRRSERVDLIVLAKLCKFFEIPSGSPVPFLIYEGDNETE